MPYSHRSETRAAMTSSFLQTVLLTYHHETPSQAVHAIHVRVSQEQGGALALTFKLEGDLARLRIPPLQSPRWAAGLWQHTCCEAFVAIQDTPAYYEFNFAPSSEWAAYAFRGYRDGGPLAEEDLAPGIVVRSTADRLELDAVLRLDRLPLIVLSARLRLGLSAVVEETDGRLSYWALKHAPGKPDFHHRESFVLEF